MPSKREGVSGGKEYAIRWEGVRNPGGKVHVKGYVEMFLPGLVKI